MYVLMVALRLSTDLRILSIVALNVIPDQLLVYLLFESMVFEHTG